MSLREILGEAERLANKAIKTDPTEINDDFRNQTTNRQGVYLLSKENQIIYIGQGKNLRMRIGQHLMDNEDTSKSAFSRALDREYGIKPLETKDWITKNCRITIKEIENPDMCKLVELLLIAYYRAINKKLLNS